MRKLLSALSFFALLIATTASLHAQAPAQTTPAPATPATPVSKIFTSQDGHFNVIFAGEPKKDTQVVKLADGASTTMYQFALEHDSGYVTYTLIYNDYPAEYANGDPQGVLANVRDGVVTGKTLISDVPITLSGIQGRAFTASDSNGWYYTVHQYLKGKRLYQLIVINVSGHPALYTDQFMSSFHIW
jgi:hypothetical protein